MITLKEVFTFRTIATLLISIFAIYLYQNSSVTALFIVYLPFLGLFIPRTRYVSYVYIGRILLPIALGLYAVYGWTAIHGDPSNAAYIRFAIRELASVDTFVSILSTLYAICIAFLLWKGLTDYDGLRRSLRDEAITMQSINDYFHYLSGNAKNIHSINKIRDLFLQYIDNVVEGRRIAASLENERFLKDIIGLISKMKIRDDNDGIALSEIMKEVSTLTHVRSLRLSHMESRMSPYLLVFLAVMSCLLLLPFLLRDPGNTIVLHILIFSLVFFFSFLYIMLLDINDPFDGHYLVKIEAFSDTKRLIEQDKADVG